MSTDTQLAILILRWELGSILHGEKVLQSSYRTVTRNPEVLVTTSWNDAR